ncbi:MAG: serine/threonine protein kinase [Xanthomonadales bacterium]|nr:Serine/threonine-protein kinase PknD [Xanthomonadales bacterium]MCC6591809.1 serine/threonine protein kinase [Xanthomonadales bacterium]
MSADHIPAIPGYRVLRPLGRGGMASVYLAVQESVDREVALKIMAPQLSADPSFGERFLREARIAAKLHHRHVVSIYDVGVHHGFHFCTMEFLPGGPVMRRGSPPLALKPTLRCVREIAQALHYAHEKGFIHRDVKPDNILLREDGSSVLGDFGIARAADSGTMMTKTGSVVGTPHYMSPEQLRGRAIDGRADLYSLGVVFFQLVTGRVPYEASDSLAVGIMHMTAPLPQLPPEYRILQPILDRMLAKEPADRFQTGAEIDAALAEAEKAMAGGASELPTRRVTSNPGETTLEVSPLVADRPPRRHDSQGSVRTEPQLGRLDRIDEDAMRAPPRPQTQFSRAHQAPPAPRRSPLYALLLLATLLGVGYWQRERIGPWLAQQLVPAANPQLDRADRALAEGRLSGQTGEDALSLYVAALLLDGEDARARAGVAETVRRLYAELSAGPPEAARIEEVARRLTGVPGFTTEPDRFRSLLPVAPGSKELLAAQAAESEGRLDGPAGALANYAAAQLQEPTSEAARAGIDRVALALSAQARSRFAAGDVEGAQRIQHELAAVPTAAAIATALAAELQAPPAPSAESVRIAALLAEAGTLARQGRLVEPAGRSAADRYREVLGLDPQHAEAVAGLTRVAGSALSQVDAAIEAKDFDRAEALRKRIARLAPRTPGLTDVRERIEDARAAARAADPERIAARDKLVREGELALASEQWLEPIGDSAYDKFRGALAIDPRSESARAGMAAIAQALRARIEQAITAGRATRADGDIAALETVDPRFDTTPLKVRVATVYASNGLRSLERGAVEQAREDLAAAERLNAADATAARLRAALAGR